MEPVTIPSTPFASVRARLLLALAPLAAYLPLFYGVYFLSPAGTNATDLSVVGVAMAGWLLGRWAGLASGLCALPINFLLLWSVGIEVSDAAALAGNAAVGATNLGIGWLVGWMGELYHRVHAQSRELARDHDTLKREVAERKRVEDRLRESEELFRLITENTNDMITLWDPRGKLLYCSTAFARTFGYEIPTTFESLFADAIHPDDVAMASAALGRAREGGLEGLNFRVRHRDGTWRWLEAWGTLVPWREERYVLGVCHEITARHDAEEALRRSREHYQALVDSIDCMVWECDFPSLQMTYVSPFAERLLGVPAQRWLDEPGFWKTRLHPDDREATIRLSHAATKALRDHELVYRMVATDRRVVWVRDRVKVIVEDGKPVKLRGVTVDVTEMTRTEERLRQAQKMDAIGRLAGGVAHDFNNLLTVINGYSEMLKASVEAGSPAHQIAGQIHSAGDRAAALTRKLLAFGRKQLVRHRPLDLNAMVAGMRQLLTHMVGEDVEADFSLAAGALPIKADPAQVEQVLLNLVVNARDAMPEGGRLTIATSEPTGADAAPVAGVPAPPHVVLEVRDTGVGMSEAVRSRLFEPFFTTKGVGQGTGLGLATVYGIVKQSGGHIDVQTAVGQGTTFRIYLPRCAESVPRPDTAAEPERLPGGGEVILLAEDQPLVRELAARCLRQAGYTVLDAPSAPDAARVCESHEGPIHLLLTDVVMPHLSGAALAQQAQERRPDLKVLFMSGHTDDAVLRRGIREDGVPFVQKPFTPESLTRKVREVLDG